MPEYLYKLAREPWEFEQIHKLNYQTFVKEIPQHHINPDRKLIDKFHDENTYIICIKDRELIGMVALRDKRPFSLDHKLKNLDKYIPEAKSVCEVRLLSINKQYRSGKVIKGLFEKLARYGSDKNYDLTVISATVSQVKLYSRLGFTPFGMPVGKQPAMFQPMYLTLSSFEKLRENSKLLTNNNSFKYDDSNANFLTGPVEISKAVREEFFKTPVSHRSEEFVYDFQKTKKLLCELTNSKYVEILFGSGTLANHAIAAQLTQQNCKGVILSNGEFGSRLIDHAARMGLDFRTHKTDWGSSFNYKHIERIIENGKDVSWLWFVHCETSTGILNDLHLLIDICDKYQIKLCVDCISSIGNTPLNLNGVYLASGSSGKGLLSYSGLSMVFYNHQIKPNPTKIPKYLDLVTYSQSKGIPYTVSSNLIYALKKSLESTNTNQRYLDMKEHSNYLRANLNELGFNIISDEKHSLPALLTIDLPGYLSSYGLGKYLEGMGFLINYMSEYFLERNWIQISLMSGCDFSMIDKLMAQLKQYCFYHEKIC
jgi:aspartate aminotransferase-like enzyme